MNTIAAALRSKVVDILFIFGLLGGAATTLGLAAPLLLKVLTTYSACQKIT
ncbi:BCCT family transporter [Vibrio lentus]|nr:BCCT family transporter [Vibrio lentus]